MLNSHNDLGKVELQIGPLFDKPLLLDEVHEFTSRQILQKQVQVKFILKRVADVHAKVCFGQLLQHVSLIDNVTDLLAGAVDFRFVYHFAREERLGVHVSDELHDTKRASTQDTHRVEV